MTPKHRFKTDEKVYLLDASIINLCFAAFPLVTYRQKKGSIKLHVGLDADGYLPEFIDGVTNAHHPPAATVATIYKEPWKIELFFKWIKQNLKIKSFLGTSENAVLTQIWIALCVYQVPGVPGVSVKDRSINAADLAVITTESVRAA